ncbi:hypothetical protein PG996_008383 [Apiospora saccharicola]|uniref:Secreted protein n=1 Tax=Apiospora saccharicola TaxID=335842 RepID=A0ABR1UXR3_9PEZI
MKEKISRNGATSRLAGIHRLPRFLSLLLLFLARLILDRALKALVTLGLLAHQSDAAVDLQPALEVEAGAVLGHGGRFLLGVAARPGGGGGGEVGGDGLLELALVAALFGPQHVLDGVASCDPALFQALQAAGALLAVRGVFTVQEPLRLRVNLLGDFDVLVDVLVEVQLGPVPG